VSVRELLYEKHFAGTVIQVVVELVRLTTGMTLPLAFHGVRWPASSVREADKSSPDVVKTGGAAQAETWMCAA
jgi:hypothetical protein